MDTGKAGERIEEKWEYAQAEEMSGGSLQREKSNMTNEKQQIGKTGKEEKDKGGERRIKGMEGRSGGIKSVCGK